MKTNKYAYKGKIIVSLNFEFRFGSNKVKERKMSTIWEMILDGFEDPILQILIFAAVISIVIGVGQRGAEGLIDGASILFTVLIITSVNTSNNYVNEKQF